MPGVEAHEFLDVTLDGIGRNLRDYLFDQRIAGGNGQCGSSGKTDEVNN